MDKMFKSVILEDNKVGIPCYYKVGIPCYYSDNYYWLTWEEDESVEDVLKKHAKDNILKEYMKFEVLPEYEDHDVYLEIYVYEMCCHKTENYYYLLVCGGIGEFDDIFHSVSFPYNRFNLISFFNKINELNDVFYN